MGPLLAGRRNRPLTARRRQKKPTEAATEWVRKAALSTHISEDVLKEMRNCVVHLSGPPDRLTISSLVETALRRELERMRRKRNRGKPFKGSHQELRPGRPIGS